MSRPQLKRDLRQLMKGHLISDQAGNDQVADADEPSAVLF